MRDLLLEGSLASWEEKREESMRFFWRAEFLDKLSKELFIIVLNNIYNYCQYIK